MAKLVLKSHGQRARPVLIFNPMKRAFVIFAIFGLAGCVTGCVTAGPSYSPQELGAMRMSATQNEADARTHKITWVEAAQRDTAKAREIGGARVTPDDELNFSMHAALAAEVDAGRMSPEMANFKYQQALAEQRANAQARQAEQQRRSAEQFDAGLRMMQAGMAPNRSINCTSTQTGIFTNTTCN